MKKKILGFWLIVFVSFFGIGQEICDNGIDDDADGLVDLNDVTDCSCNSTFTFDVTSLIPNPSFEEYTSCPTKISQMDSAIGWFTPVSTTPDYLNTCGFLDGNQMSNAGMLPFPDGNGIARCILTNFYKEYIAIKLPQPLVAGSHYTLIYNLASFIENKASRAINAISYPFIPVDFTIYGSAEINPSFPVYTNWERSTIEDDSWKALGSASFSPPNAWNEFSISFTPTTNISSIILGAPQTNGEKYFDYWETEYLYFLIDNLILNQTNLIESVSITSEGSFCTDDLVLTANVSHLVTPTNPTYQWYKNGVALLNETTTTYTVPTGTAGIGNYQVRLSDGGLCANSPIEIVKSTIPIISIVDLTDQMCKGDSAKINVSGSTTFNWSPSETLSASTGASVLAKPTQTTTYTVVAGENSCTSSQEITITVKDTKADAGKDTSICIGSSITLNASGGATYVWSHGETTANISVSPTTETNYIVTAKDGICSSKDSVLVKVNPLPIVTLPAEIILTAFGSTVLSASGGQSYLWTPATGLSCTTCESPSASPLENTEYCVLVTDANNCKSSACTEIKINLDCGELFIPNSFSPNGDNNNDKLDVKIIPTCVESYDFKIFDRWGEIVFETTKITDSWDGKVNGKDLDNAVFVYSLTIKLKDKIEPIVKKGNVSIIK